MERMSPQKEEMKKLQTVGTKKKKDWVREDNYWGKEAKSREIALGVLKKTNTRGQSKVRKQPLIKIIQKKGGSKRLS